jgi:hypothetical protein
MTDKETKDIPPGQNMTDVLKSWMMVALTLIFVLLYAAALFGWLKPQTDVTMITRLEPIIFVIIGYYFGRLPAQQNEKTLKDEINRQTQKADAAQNAKEQVKQEREALEEKLKNVKVALSSNTFNVTTKALNENNAAEVTTTSETLRSAVTTAINILNS